MEESRDFAIDAKHRRFTRQGFADRKNHPQLL